MIILLVDDDVDNCRVLQDFLQKMDHIAICAYTATDALAVLRVSSVDLIITDVMLPDMNGLELVRKIFTKNLSCEIIVISGKEDVARIINSFDLGITDFLTKPIDINVLAKLVQQVQAAIKKKKMLAGSVFSNIRQHLNSTKIFKLNNLALEHDFYISQNSCCKGVAFSDKIKNILHKADKVIDFEEIPILIQGETGTGKEIIANYLHCMNPNCKSIPFIAINCTTINDETFSAELFGYEKGSFTGGDPKGKEGLFKAAENGTIFLDEISEISREGQAKLLRVLQTREYYKVGGQKSQKLKARIIFASNRNLLKFVKKGFFRKDLYYRLSTCAITVPPLRQRPEDILPLVVYFIKEFNERLDNKITQIESAAIETLLDYSWPGNVRELRNVIQNITLFQSGKTLKKEYLKNLESEKRTSETEQPAKSCCSSSPQPINVDNYDLPVKSFDLEEYTKGIVRKAIVRFAGNKSKAAKFLRLSRTQLYYRFKD